MRLEDILIKNEKVLLEIKPDKKVIMLWLVPVLLSIIISPLVFFLAIFLIKDVRVRFLYMSTLFVVMMLPVLIMLATLHTLPQYSFALILGSFVLTFIIIVTLFYLALRVIYSKLRAVFTDRRVIFSSGLISDFVHIVTYDRISDVKVTSGAYESVFGLKSLALETLAGQRLRGKRGYRALGEIVLEGLGKEQTKKIEALLLGKMKKEAIL